MPPPYRAAYTCVPSSEVATPSQYVFATIGALVCVQVVPLSLEAYTAPPLLDCTAYTCVPSCEVAMLYHFALGALVAAQVVPLSVDL